MSRDISSFLSEAYDKAMTAASGKGKVTSAIRTEAAALLDTIVSYSESNKGVLAVLTTSIVYKHFNPEQDIRCHQSSIPNGYSGRTFDSKYITPFLKQCRFPAMAESGWLTRSLEQKTPYDRNFKGAIKPQTLKDAFLSLLEMLEEKHVRPSLMLDYLLQALIIKRDNDVVDLAIPSNLSIAELMVVLDRHFHARYKATGASRLPVLALYAIYQSLINDGFKRYVGKNLLSLENHTSADTRSGRLGDIDINDSDGNPFEAVEVKFDIPISFNIVVNAVEKIHPTSISRYYILSTTPMAEEEKRKIGDEVKKLKNTHGCQLVINGVMPTLKYYLRLLDDPNNFIKNYTRLLSADGSIKFEHKLKWNEIIAKL